MNLGLLGLRLIYKVGRFERPSQGIAMHFRVLPMSRGRVRKMFNTMKVWAKMPAADSRKPYAVLSQL